MEWNWPKKKKTLKYNTVLLPMTRMQLTSFAAYLMSLFTPELVYILFTRKSPVIVYWNTLVTVHRLKIHNPSHILCSTTLKKAVIWSITISIEIKVSLLLTEFPLVIRAFKYLYAELGKTYGLAIQKHCIKIKLSYS